METAWKSAGDGCEDGSTAGYDSRRQNTHVTSYSYDVCNISNTSYDWRTPAGVTEASVVHALMFNVTGNTKFNNTGVDSNSIHHRVPDPHMMCLKLGKRHYCKDSAESSSTTGKRGNPSSSPAPVVPRCQVEGCHVTLGDGKEYYRKHKVCELHSKSPKVVVSGVLQRFCQQCSRFHGVTEFDEAKRSCRRRLKGHNQRRRKGTNSVKLLPSSNSGCAYSLLSSPVTKPAGDLPARCSAALYELIVANRANSNSGHISNQNVYHQSVSDDSTHTFQGTQMWDRIGYTTATAVETTEKVDVKQSPALEIGLLKVKDPEEWTDYCW